MRGRPGLLPAGQLRIKSAAVEPIDTNVTATSPFGDGSSGDFLRGRWPLRAYFVLLALLVGFAAIGGALYVSRQAEDRARSDVAEEAGFAAETAATQFGAHIAVLKATVAQLAANPLIGKVFSDARGCTLNYQGLGGPDQGHIDIVRADGAVLCSSRKQIDASDRPYAGSPWLRDSLARTVFAAPARDSATGAHVAIAAAPIPGGKGVVAGFSDLDAVGPVLASLYGGARPFAFLVTTGDRQTVVARSIDPERWIGKSLVDTAFATAGGPSERRDLDGRSRLYEDFAVPGLGWHFFAGADRASALASAHQLRRSQLEIIAAGLIGFLIALWFGYRKVVAPIRRLSGDLRSRTDSLGSPVVVDGPVEVAALAEEFNGLLESVRTELRQREEAEQTARDAERNYRLLFENNPNPMWVFDAETLRFRAVNEQAVQSYGYSREEFLGMTIEDIREPGELDQLHATLRHLEPQVERGFNQAGIWKHRRKDGSILDVEVSSHEHEFEGRPARVVLALDVTERVRAEKALLGSEERYRDLFENASDLIATADLTGRLTAVNKAFARTLGYSEEELAGKSLLDLVPEHQRALLSQARNGKLADGDVTVYEHDLICKDGRLVEVEVSSKLTEKDGIPIGIEAICRDISERKHLEEQLRQAQRLEAVGKLAGGVAHDFNNLLTVISGYAEALLPEVDPRNEPDLRQIAFAAERAAILTRQLLAFSRRQVLEPRILDPNEIVSGLTPMLSRLIGEHIELVTATDPDCGMVCADAGQLEQVLVNLAVNARDAMPAGGRLTIQTGRADLDDDYVAHHGGSLPGPHVMISVTDTGSGMDPETLAQMFDPFFTTKAIGQGTGLGLATVYGIIKQSGGNIWAYSEVGIGTTFKVYLPSAEGRPVAAGDRRSTGAGATGSERVLIAEDEESLRTLATRMLEQRGYSVLAADNAEHALELVEQSPDRIDLLLTDLVMPKMSGRALADSVRERNPGMRVLFMSGYADETVTESGALEQGAAFLEKPFSGEDLAQKVRQTLDA
jgi:two-component system, cell cycle sensor histidine kinase and response regulator CckA